MIPLTCPTCGSGDPETYETACLEPSLDGGDADPWHTSEAVEVTFAGMAALANIEECGSPVLAHVMAVLASWHGASLEEPPEAPAYLAEALDALHDDDLAAWHLAIAEQVAKRAAP